MRWLPPRSPPALEKRNKSRSGGTLGEGGAEWEMAAASLYDDVLLIPKNAASVKPTALVPTLIRWWEAMRAPKVAKWQQKYRIYWDATDGRNGGAQRQDTDAHLHEERVISVRKEAEFAHRVPPSRCPRWNADTLETSCRRDVKEFSGGDQSAKTVQMIQKVSHSKVQNMLMPGPILQITSRRKTSLREREERA